ncbi:uncharacterized protein [Temnothorax nylanderi]|uniref:uncharacterized protein isoform X4 n=1 Tax=Temnothorax nylanderi TaxID=102681 RepID=UPI003A8743E2
MSCDESIFCCYKRPEYSINESNVDSIDLEVRPYQSTASSSSPSSPQKNSLFHRLRYGWLDIPDSANIVRSLAYANFSVSNLDIREILRRSIESPARLNMIKEEALLYGHDIVFRELLNSPPEVTGAMILDVCRLLEISPLEIDNRLEYIKLILGWEFRKTMDVRSVDGALAHLNMIKKEALLYGHDIIFRELLNSRPKVTGKMILEVCRLLEISPLEIENASDQLEYIKLILGQGFRETIDVRSVDGALADLNMIKNQALLYGHDIIFRELLNSRPEVTGKMILEVCRLLEISPLEIENASDQLEYIKLILGQGFRETIDVRSVDGALADLNLIKDKARSYGHNIIFRELLNSRPKVTGKMILEVCRLLEILPLKIDYQLEYMKLILRRGFRETMDVCSVDDALAHLNMIKKEALLYGHDIIFRELLNSRPEVTGTMILDVCRLLEISPLEIDNQLEYIKLILGQGFRETMDVRSVDDIGNTALHYALERNWYEAATVLLKEGSYLGQVNKFNNIVIADIPEFTLSSYFNDCIQLKNEWTDKCTIEFDYRCLMPHENFTDQQEISRATCEMEVILYIANNDTLKHLLRHPLISSFLYIKWYMIRHVLYANFVFYTMFYFFVNAYILSMTYDTSRNRQQIANDSFNTVFACTLQNNLSWVFAMGMLLFFTSREILQFISYPQRYLVDLENWSQVLLIVLTLALLCGAGLQIGVMVILLSTWELMTLISHHLFPSTCIEMFRTVFFNFVRFFFPYLILILAFTLAFYMLLRNDGFSNPGLSLFKTIIMFTGEFDANDISFSAYPVWSRIVLMMFIFYIVIVLFNLLNGLAISNIAEILNNAEIIGLISRVRLIACFERMIVAKPFCWNSKWTLSNPFNFFSNKILLFPHYLRCGKISFKPYDDNLIVYDGDRHNVDDSMDYKRWSTLKMDPNIVKHAKQVVYDKNELSNDGIMNELAKLQTRLTQIKITLRCEVDAEENII